MKIAIHSADLDHERIDGTRVYLLNMLKNFALLDQKDSFLIYHQNNFNPQLAPPTFANYFVKKLPFSFFWTQTRFAWQLFRDKPAVLWMPVHNMPIIRRKNLQTVVTIHDLAFKIFPQYFPAKDLVKLNRLSDLSIKNATRIIAVSQATKKDILKFYPQITENKISVVHHGFDVQLFSQKISQQESEELLKNYKLKAKSYILYVGAIQPRKNLEVLIEAFEKVKIKSASRRTELKLVIAGAPAWQYEATLEKIAQSKFKKDIIVTGTVPFADLAVLYQNAAVFVFPSLYEGFGIPVLEAMASGVPVIVANNSSLPEVAGEAALYFDTTDAAALAACLERVMLDETLRSALIEKGRQRAAEFSWQKCARQTLDIILKK
jgi:glycosyltransferase involved in cell wall biosynthesis